MVLDLPTMKGWKAELTWTIISNSYAVAKGWGRIAPPKYWADRKSFSLNIFIQKHAKLKAKHARKTFQQMEILKTYNLRCRKLSENCNFLLCLLFKPERDIFCDPLYLTGMLQKLIHA